MEKSLNPSAPIADTFYPRNITPSSKVLEKFPKLTLNEKEFIPRPAHRSNRKRPPRSSRFKTQPITFSEIKEVDEESILAISNQSAKSQTGDLKTSVETDKQVMFSKLNKAIVVSEERVDLKSSNSKSFLPP